MHDFDYRFCVRLHDTDAAGVMFFAHLFRYAHDAYEACLSMLGLDLASLIAAGGPQLPLVHAEADYRAPLRHGDQVWVRVTLERLGNQSFTLGYLFAGVDGRERARARTVHVAMDPLLGGPVNLPSALRNALEQPA